MGKVATTVAVTMVASTTLILGGCSGDSGTKASPGDFSIPITKNPSASKVELGAPKGTYEELGELTHDRSSFTEGLALTPQGSLLESTGKYGHSKVNLLNSSTGKGILGVSMREKEFGEGITVLRSEIIQGTWRNGYLIKRDVNTLQEKTRIPVRGEVWGLCATDDFTLWMSNGGTTLQSIDATDGKVLSTVQVKLKTPGKMQLNELECLGNNKVLANVAGSATVLSINTLSGEVEKIYDFSTVVKRARERGSRGDLNGLAYDKKNGHLYLTGKEWPFILKVHLN